MAAPLRVNLSPTAERELKAVWQWNAEHYSVPHASRYLTFLRGCIAELSRSYSKGLRVGSRPDLRFILMRQRTSGHGHVAVYKVDNQTVEVLHVFHTAQDWQGTLTTEQP